VKATQESQHCSFTAANSISDFSTALRGDFVAAAVSKPARVSVVRKRYRLAFNLSVLCMRSGRESDRYGTRSCHRGGLGALP
jgi:hypothetical protein